MQNQPHGPKSVENNDITLFREPFLHMYMEFPTSNRANEAPQSYQAVGIVFWIFCFELLPKTGFLKNFPQNSLLESLKSRVWREHYRTLKAIVEGVRSMYGQYDVNSLELVWQSLFKRYNQILTALGGSDVDIGHATSRKWQRQRCLDCLVLIDKAAYDVTFNWWIDREDRSNEQ